MTFGDSLIFLFVMLLASVLVATVIFAGALTVSFISGAKPMVEPPGGAPPKKEAGE